MVDSVCSPNFLQDYKIKSGNGLGTRLLYRHFLLPQEELFVLYASHIQYLLVCSDDDGV